MDKDLFLLILFDHRAIVFRFLFVFVCLGDTDTLVVARLGFVDQGVDGSDEGGGFGRGLDDIGSCRHCYHIVVKRIETCPNSLAILHCCNSTVFGTLGSQLYETLIGSLQFVQHGGEAKGSS